MTAVRLALLLLAIGFQAAQGRQVQGARSADYLFLTNVSDARALWVNPAGLGLIPEASLFGEGVVERTMAGDLRLSQYTVGLNSRGFSLGYQRDRFVSDTSTAILRAALALPFTHGAIGAAVSLHRRPGDNKRSTDIGVMYGPSAALNWGAVVRNIGRPELGDVTLPLTFESGIHLTGLDGNLLVLGEVHAVERMAETESGYDVTYRGGMRVSLPLAYPVSILAAGDLASNLRLDRLHVGVMLGGRSGVVAVGSGLRRDGAPQLDRVSVAAFSSNNLLTGRR